jgi:hypothetical protein
MALSLQGVILRDPKVELANPDDHIPYLSYRKPFSNEGVTPIT